MSTTEILIEQVLTGLLVMAVLALPFVPTPDAGWGSIAVKDVASLTVALAAVGYLVGVPFDRLADTITSGLEKRVRLRLTWCRYLKAPLTDTDPFPEGALRALVSENAKESSLGYLDYLRSRMRIARALGVYMPALTASAMLRLAADRPMSAGVLLAIGLAYASVAVLVTWDPWAPRRSGRRIVDRRSRLIESPRDLAGFWENAGASHREHHLAMRLRCDPLPWWLLLFFGIVLGAGTTVALTGAMSADVRCALLTLPLAGSLLTALALWAWWRILVTYQVFLYQLGRVPSMRSMLRIQGT